MTVNAVSRVPEGAPGHSILQHDMPGNEEPDGEEARQHPLEHGPPRVSASGKKTAHNLKTPHRRQGMAVLILSGDR